MTAYATAADVQARMTRQMTEDEQEICSTLLDDAKVIIDSTKTSATADAKKVVSCRMVMRMIGDGNDISIPMGATQGSQSALGYSQSWTIGSGSAGELYLSKSDKALLGISNKIGISNPYAVFPEETQ